MNNETPGHTDAPMPPGDATAKPGAGRNRRTTRRALLAGLGAAGLAAGATAYWCLLSDDIVGGVVVHARARELPSLRFTDGNRSDEPRRISRPGRAAQRVGYLVWSVP